MTPTTDPTTMTRDDLLDFIERTERAHFRTHMDTGANLNALFTWNLLREFAGLPELTEVDLVQRYADMVEQDRRHHLADGNIEAAERSLRSWHELNDILTAPNPYDAIDEQRRRIRDLQWKAAR